MGRAADHIIQTYPLAALEGPIYQTITVAGSLAVTQGLADSVCRVHAEAVVANCSAVEEEETFSLTVNPVTSAIY